MRALFCNTSEPRCGVFQYGWNLYDILKDSEATHWEYYGGVSAPPMSTLRRFDVILYNWSSLIGGWMAAAPIQHMGKQVFCYHDGPVADGFDATLFSDPTMPSHDHWHSIGRPLPQIDRPHLYQKPNQYKYSPIIGVHGFMGAWATHVVKQALAEFEFCTIRLQLPFSPFVDPYGAVAKSTAQQCRDMAQGRYVELEVSHDFLSPNQLIQWLVQNDINCYLRDVNMPWRGVSSAPDYAMAVRRPIAVNRSSAFRHLHGLFPSICVEDRSLSEILITGLSPLVPLYAAWRPEQIRKQVEDVLVKL